MAGSRTIQLSAAGGEHTSAAFEEQPTGTTRRIRNMRGYDARARVDRLCQRPGHSRTISTPAGASRIRAVQGLGLFKNLGTLALGELRQTDTFVRGNTSAGAMGDFTGDAAADYTVCVGAAGATKLFGDSAAVGFTNVGATGAYVNAAYSAGNAAKIRDNTLVDDRNDSTFTGTSLQLTLSAAYLTSVDRVLTDNFALRVFFRTQGSMANKYGFVGLFCCGKSSDVTGGSEDGAYGFGVSRFKDATGADSNQIHSCMYGNNAANPIQFPILDVDDTRSALGDNHGFWSPSQEYVLELRKVGVFVEGYFEGQLVFQSQDITLSPQTLVDNTQNEYGIVFGNVGSGGGAAFAAITRFEIWDCDVVQPQPTRRVLVSIDDDLRVGDENAVSGSEWTTVAGASGIISTAGRPTILVGPGPTATGNIQRVFVLDGTQYLDVNVLTATSSTWTPTEGSLPVQGLSRCRYGLLWDSRVVLYGMDAQPDNFWMSERNNPYGWNPLPTTRSIRQAVFGDESDCGLPSADISCIAPVGHEWLAMAGVSSLFLLDGNPADNGRLRGVSTSVGIVGPGAWAQDFAGTLYFQGFDGIYRWAPGAIEPEPLSIGRIDRFFQTINHDTQEVLLAWDNELDGLHIYVVCNETDAICEHRFWSRRLNRFDPDTIAFAHAPYSVGYFPDPSVSGGRRILLGCQDGIVRQPDVAADTDDEQFIDAAVMFGPLIGENQQRILLSDITARLGSETKAARYAIHSGETAEEIGSSSEPRVEGTWEGRANQHTCRARVSGGAVGIEIGNNDRTGRLVIERVMCTAEIRARARGALA